MVSSHLREYALQKYQDRREYYRPVLEEIERKLALCTQEEEILMRFLYGTMPVRDGGEYGFEVFLSFVKHALWLRENVEWCRELPEDIFVHHVLYYRINSEDISDCRSFFCRKLQSRISGMTLKEAVLEINYWCAEHVVYESTDSRTASPMTLYRCGRGRCGEESTFAVTAYRSVGIPARQVYTPRWAHCDDNHAWVEVYVEGEWYFLGACEPEGILNKGWFAAPASRAILIHSRTFCDFVSQSAEECVGREEMLIYYNNTSAYGKTAVLTIKVKDRLGNPVKEASVALEILNMSEFFPAAVLLTDELGEARITAGRGTVHIRAWKGSFFAECNASIHEKSTIELSLERNTADTEWACDQWESFLFTAPEETAMHSGKETKEIRERNAERLKEAVRLREQRSADIFPYEEAAEYPREEQMLRIAGENNTEILEFLNKDKNPYRKIMLHGLAPKDYKDVKACILEDHLSCQNGDWEDEIFEKYLLCPRIYLEELTPYRSFIRAYFTEEEKNAFRKCPDKIWEYISNKISYDPQADYKTICATPAGCLKLKHGNELSCKILFVAVCRSLQIPARLDKATLVPEYYHGNRFRSIVCDKNQQPEMKQKVKAALILETEEGSKWKYFQNWTIGRWEGAGFKTLDLEGIKFRDNHLSLKLEPGIYRILTSLRMPDGGQHVSSRVFELHSKENKQVEMALWENNREDMLVSIPLEDFQLMGLQGQTYLLSQAAEDKSVILAFMGVGAEPTEHVLNELLDCALRWNEFGAKLIMVLKDADDLNHATLQKVLDQLSGIRVFFDSKGYSEKVAGIMNVDPEKLPVLTVVEEGKGIYACSGYNVGSVELMLNLMRL